MSYAIPRDIVWAGLLLAACFAVGMIVTVAAFLLVALLLRTRLMDWMARPDPREVGSPQRRVSRPRWP